MVRVSSKTIMVNQRHCIPRFNRVVVVVGRRASLARVVLYHAFPSHSTADCCTNQDADYDRGDHEKRPDFHAEDDSGWAVVVEAILGQAT